MAWFAPGSGGNPFTDVELTLSCRKLRNMDFFSKSDPMIVVSQLNVLSGAWQVIGRTEMILNNLNPDFATKIVARYHFEQIQQLKFDVYDIDSPNLQNLEEHDFLGTCTASLGQVVSGGKLALHLGGSEETNLGQLLITAEELSPNESEVKVQFSARNLRRKWWCRLNAYLELHKVDEGGNYSLVYRSEVQHGSFATWQPITLTLRSLCGGDQDRSVRIRCFNTRSFGDPRLIGETSVTIRQLSAASPGEEFPLNHFRKPELITGCLNLLSFKINKIYSFLEYVLGGMQIHCTVAIDFTASNGDPNQENSLHYIHHSKPNQYQQALRSVVEILQDYDSDKQFPVLGFGARVPPDGNVSHCFYVNLRHDSPFCSGVLGVMEAYKQCICRVQLYGPTNFSPVITHVTQYAREYQDGSQYYILLIVTDGVITDMQQTKQAIITASDLPLSIIIVGVGCADFNAMDELDADVVPLSLHGRTASRDIVQFVPFRDFQKHQNPTEARLYLAQEVLAEIPAQVVGFMRSRGYVPNTGLNRTTPSVPCEPPPLYSET